MAEELSLSESLLLSESSTKALNGIARLVGMVGADLRVPRRSLAAVMALYFIALLATTELYFTDGRDTVDFGDESSSTAPLVRACGIDDRFASTLCVAAKECLSLFLGVIPPANDCLPAAPDPFRALSLPRGVTPPGNDSCCLPAANDPLGVLRLPANDFLPAATDPLGVLRLPCPEGRGLSPPTLNLPFGEVRSPNDDFRGSLASGVPD